MPRCDRVLSDRESFNSILRTICLDRWCSVRWPKLGLSSNQWLEEYNTMRPHGSLQGMNPEQFLNHWQSCRNDSKPEVLTL
ncbi:MAG: transposase [Gammaproteobacteria bacterium]|nr:transposase [Gammaproteobacteria bacterium]